MMIVADYLRCFELNQDKTIEQQREEIQKRAKADGVTIPPENWFILCEASHKMNYAERVVMRSLAGFRR